MNVTLWAWALTLLGFVALIVFDLWVVDRGKPRVFTLRQAGTWVTFYVMLAVGFGVGVLLAAGGDYSAQFFAGYLTEYSLSVDNLFIFYVIMARFAVPRANQHMVLLIGIVIALIMRGAFIAVGAAALSRFEWLFYFFGAFLLWTAIGLLRGGGDEEEFKENALLRWVRRVVPATEGYHDHRMVVRVDGRRLVTPMLIVMIAIGSTDLLFALDSIPAIFGLTKESYLVFTANAFALMGLRQLYFLLGGLLERLVYLSKGLSVILAFIGVKLILQAMHETGLAPVPEVPIWLSLLIIGTTMVVTTAASLLRARREPAVTPQLHVGAAPPGGGERVRPTADPDGGTDPARPRDRETRPRGRTDEESDGADEERSRPSSRRSGPVLSTADTGEAPPASRHGASEPPLAAAEAEDGPRPERRVTERRGSAADAEDVPEADRRRTAGRMRPGGESEDERDSERASGAGERPATPIPHWRRMPR